LAQFDAAAEKQFRTHKKAWKYFQAQSPAYRHMVTWWAVSAKRPETRQKRLVMLIECCEKEQPIPGLQRPAKGKKTAPKS
jgi:hypothetical protein